MQQAFVKMPLFAGLSGTKGARCESDLELTSSFADERLRPSSSSSLVALVVNFVSFSVGLEEADEVNTQVKT